MSKKRSKKGGNPISLLIDLLNLTQTEFAKLVGVPRHEIRNVNYLGTALSNDTAFRLFLATGFNDNEMQRGRLTKDSSSSRAGTWARVLKTKVSELEKFELIATNLLQQTMAAVKQPTYRHPSHRALLIFELLLCLSRFRAHTGLARKDKTIKWLKRGKDGGDEPLWVVYLALALCGSKEPNYAEVRKSLGLVEKT